MNYNQIYIYITIAILLYYIFSKSIVERFVHKNDFVYSRIPYLFNTSIYNLPIYQDIRGSPNAAYTMDSFGSMTHIGYKFGPYLYDTQGNRIKYMNNSYYVS